MGDEYMCVSGIPTQNKEHAYRAAMLALDMITAVEEAREITGYHELACRIGVHSGAVVAGVLRGDKPRFQLFGDTVRRRPTPDSA